MKMHYQIPRIPTKWHDKTQGDTYSRPSNANKKLFNKKHKKSQEDET